MKIPTATALVKSSALVVAIVGGMMLAAPKSAEAAPAMAPVDVVAPASGLTEVRYHGRHRRHFGHYRGRHFGHYRGRRFGHHYGRRHHVHGRRFRY